MCQLGDIALPPRIYSDPANEKGSRPFGVRLDVADRGVQMHELWAERWRVQWWFLFVRWNCEGNLNGCKDEDCGNRTSPNFICVKGVIAAVPTLVSESARRTGGYLTQVLICASTCEVFPLLFQGFEVRLS